MNRPAVVLVAEDDVLVRNMINLVLTRASYSVLIACDGAEALELSRHYTGEIHLLLSDVTMPRMDGVTLAARLREERPRTLTLLISGKTSSEISLGKPGFEFLRKPFRPDQLRRKIEEMMLALSGDGLSPVPGTSGAVPDSGSV